MRMSITTEMEVVESQIQDLFKNLYCKEDFEKRLEDAEKATTDSRPFILVGLASMINEAGYECEYGRPISYYRAIVSKLDFPNDRDEINRKIINTLNRVYSDYPTPEDFMSRIVNSIEPETAFKASLRLRILRRFLKTVNVKENQKYYSRTLAAANADEIDESVFDVLSNSEAQKDCDYVALVQTCTNVANGIFISPSMSKEQMFLLAFAFDMRYYPCEGKEYDAARDVEKNLFFDYYCDNITRYIYSEDGGKTGSADTEPSGVGINSKNFVDAIFVYYLNKENMEPTQKVAGFYRMLKRVKASWNKMYEYDDEQRKQYECKSTDRYDEKIATSIHNLSEEELESYILREYYCDVRYEYINRKTGEMQESSRGNFEFQIATNSEYREYNLILDLIKEHLDISQDTDFSRMDGRTAEYGEVIERVFGLAANIPNTDDKYFSDLSKGENDFSDFLRIIKNIEKRLNPFDAITVNDPLKMTRTKLLAAFYHWYYLENEQQGNRWTSFKDVYDNFTLNANAYLLEARYQPISVKNLYDIFIIFFAYCKSNNFLEVTEV